jgi:pilus assembly protein CpaF
MSVPAYAEIRTRTLEIVDTRRIDAETERSRVEDAASEAVADYQRKADLGETRALADPAAMVDRIVRSVADFGALTDLLARDDVEEIFIEGATVSYIDGTGRLRRLSEPTTQSETRQVVERILSTTDRRLDASSPIVQGRVLGGTARLTAVIPPVADVLSATIRRYALRKETLEWLVALDSLTAQAASFLRLVSATNSSVVVSGQPGAGKTSLLAALLHAAPVEQCIRCCEEVRELHVPLVHGSYYEARPAGLDGGGEIPLRQLVKVILSTKTTRPVPTPVVGYWGLRLGAPVGVILTGLLVFQPIGMDDLYITIEHPVSGSVSPGGREARVGPDTTVSGAGTRLLPCTMSMGSDRSAPRAHQRLPTCRGFRFVIG